MGCKIIHLPHDHGSLASSLQCGEAQLGVHNTMLYANQSSFVTQGLASKSRHLKGFLSRINAYYAARRTDILLFNYGSTVFDPPRRKHFYLDLPHYPDRVKMAMVFQGSDLRTAYPSAVQESREKELSLGHALGGQTKDGIISVAEVVRKLARVKKASRYCDRLFFVNPDLRRALPESARFMPYPVSVPITPPPQYWLGERPLRVLHLATNRVLKGTGLIEAALSNLGSDIEAKILVRVPRSEALAALDWADIVIDQMCLGWYGMQAIEALAKGKPVLCHLNTADWAQFMPNYTPQEAGFINAPHSAIADVLMDLIAQPSQLKALGDAGQGFVAAMHDPAKVVSNAYGDWINGYA